uniref:Uncharacterized protein n=1 Tax=Cannabis sativa TaxID=3483 RepID=A0A803P616_CANSA
MGLILHYSSLKWRFVGSDLANQRIVTRRSLKFQVEIDTFHQLTSGFSWILREVGKNGFSFRYFKLPKLAITMIPGHDKKPASINRYAYPPQGAAVPAYGPWMKAESAVFSYFNTRNQFDFFREGAGRSFTTVNTSPVADPNSKAMGKRQVQDVNRVQPLQHTACNRDKSLHQTACIKPTRKVIRVTNNGPGATLGRNLKVVEKTSVKPLNINIGHKFSDTLETRHPRKERKGRSVSPSVLRRHTQGMARLNPWDQDCFFILSAHLMFADDMILLPATTNNEAEKLMECISTFEKWSGQSCSNVDKDRYLALKAWDQICQPKASGVLGLRKCEDMNKALLSKLAWSLAVQADKPWVKCLLGKYQKHESFECQEEQPFFCWRGILESREAILKGSISIAASGCSINFWHQPWIPWLEFNEFVELMESIRGRGYTIQTLGDVSIDNDWNEEVIL